MLLLPFENSGSETQKERVASSGSGLNEQVEWLILTSEVK